MARRAGKSLVQPAAFWDASALVSLCVRQGISQRVGALYERYALVVWWATPVEIASALARLVRTREIDSNERAKATQVALALADEWSVIEPQNALRANAARLVEQYELRAADALQLAAALEWCEQSPFGDVFLTADQKLREAAILSGFDGKQL